MFERNILTAMWSENDVFGETRGSSEAEMNRTGTRERALTTARKYYARPAEAMSSINHAYAPPAAYPYTLCTLPLSSQVSSSLMLRATVERLEDGGRDDAMDPT